MISTPSMMELVGQITRDWISLCATAGQSSWEMLLEDYGCHKLELLRDAHEKVQLHSL